jgi:hypothetical protein
VGGGAGGGTVVPDAGTHETDAGCQGVDLSGVGVPAGTVATASSSLSTNGPGLAIDGDVNTAWNAGGFTGSITLTFPSATMIAAIRIHGEALPVTPETYTVTTSTSTTPIGSATYEVMMSPGSVLPDIEVTPGSYLDITVTINGNTSWVGADEIWVLATPACQ